MKVLCFIDSLGPGGAQRQLVGLALLLNERNFNVEIVTYHNIPFFLPLIEGRNIPYLCLRNGNFRWKRLFYLYLRIIRSKPDAIISFLDTPNILILLCRLFGLKFKLIVSERNTTQVLSLPEKFKFQLYQCSDYVVTNSYSQYYFIEKNIPNLIEKVSVITNFVDLNYFKPIFKKKNSNVVILVAATLWPSKNALGFIKAIHLLRSKCINFEVRWYGISSSYLDYYSECMELVDYLDLGDFIEFYEKDLDMLTVYQNVDYLCLPSFYEGTPNVICEALACGLPVICSNVCDNPIYVQHGFNGYLFDPYNVENVFNELHNAIVLPDDLYMEFCQRSRLTAEKLLSSDKFIDSYINLLLV